MALVATGRFNHTVRNSMRSFTWVSEFAAEHTLKIRLVPPQKAQGMVMHQSRSRGRELFARLHPGSQRPPAS